VQLLRPQAGKTSPAAADAAAQQWEKDPAMKKAKEGLALLLLVGLIVGACWFALHTSYLRGFNDGFWLGRNSGLADGRREGQLQCKAEKP
jgi:hypothetical protein